MTNGFLLCRVLLKFQSESEDLLGELSAIARTPDGSLWVGSDEQLALERLAPMGNAVYGNHKTFPVKDFVNLSDCESEIDIEGLDYANGYLWAVGSHSLKRGKTKGKKPQKDIESLSEIECDPNRYFLARFPVLNGELVPTCALSDSHEAVLTAACLQKTGDRNLLVDALIDDAHLGPFLTMGLPSKDNGAWFGQG